MKNVTSIPFSNIFNSNKQFKKIYTINKKLLFSSWISTDICLPVPTIYDKNICHMKECWFTSIFQKPAENLQLYAFLIQYTDFYLWNLGN